jgi:hypothetical protein
LVGLRTDQAEARASPRRPVCTRTRCSRPDTGPAPDDEFEEGMLDLKGAVTALAVRVVDQGAQVDILPMTHHVECVAVLEPAAKGS